MKNDAFMKVYENLFYITSRKRCSKYFQPNARVWNSYPLTVLHKMAEKKDQKEKMNIQTDMSFSDPLFHMDQN